MPSDKRHWTMRARRQLEEHHQRLLLGLGKCTAVQMYSAYAAGDVKTTRDWVVAGSECGARLRDASVLQPGNGRRTERTVTRSKPIVG